MSARSKLFGVVALIGFIFFLLVSYSYWPKITSHVVEAASVVIAASLAFRLWRESCRPPS